MKILVGYVRFEKDHLARYVCWNALNLYFFALNSIYLEHYFVLYPEKFHFIIFIYFSAVYSFCYHILN